MKLFLARQRVGSAFGGAEGYVAALGDALSRQGADVSYLAQMAGEDVDAARVIRCRTWPTNLGAVYRFSRDVMAFVDAQPSAVVLAFDRLPGAAMYRAGDGTHQAYLDAMRSPLWRRLSPKHQMILSLEQEMFDDPRLRAVIANSRMVARDIESAFPQVKERIRVVHTGLTTEFRRDIPDRRAARLGLSADLDEKILLFAGHGFERKGLDTCLRAVAALPPDTLEQLSLWIIGRDNPDSYKHLSAELGIESNVHFWGAQRDLRLFYAAADLFVLPTRYDPLARVCIEAAACGCPVITSLRNGFSDFLSDSFVLNDPNDSAALANLISRALASDLEAAGDDLRRKVAELSIDDNAKQVLACLRAEVHK